MAWVKFPLSQHSQLPGGILAGQSAPFSRGTFLLEELQAPAVLICCCCVFKAYLPISRAMCWLKQTLGGRRREGAVRAVYVGTRSLFQSLAHNPRL